MAIIKKIMGQITLKVVVDVVSTTYYYLLMPSAAPIPAKPTTSPPPTYTETGYEGWQTTEPGYTSGDTRSLYVTVRTVYSNGTFEYTAPSLSSSYEAAKQAYNRAQSAMTLAADTNNYFWWLTSSDDSDIPTGAYVTNIPKTTFMQNKTGGNVITQSTGITIRNGTTQLASLTGQALNFYNPQAVQGQQALQLSIGANGTLQSGNYSRGSDSKFSSSGTKIDLTYGDIITKYFRLSQGAEAGGPNAGAYIHGTIEALDGRIGGYRQDGTTTSNYWDIGNFTDYNLQSSAKIIGHGSSFIQLGDSLTWRLATNRIHTGWYEPTQDSYLHFPNFDDALSVRKHWDYGMHVPTAYNDKFLYIRNASNNTSFSDLLGDIDDTDSQHKWAYKFWIDGSGNVYAPNLYKWQNSRWTPVDAGGAVDSASKLSSYGGSSTKPVYFPSTGVPTAIDYTIGQSIPSDSIWIKSVSTTGNGNAVTNVSFNSSTGAVTATKGTTFLTQHQDISGKADKATTLAGYGITDALSSSLKGANNGLAELDSAGKVPSSQLPSYVDDVLEYASQSSFPATGESGKIYIATNTNKTYRWSGTAYTEISESLALGETSSTAYYGDKGKAAYDHATAKGSAFASGLYKITTNAEGHVTGAAAVVKADITGLGIPAQDTTYSFSANNPTLSWGVESTIGTAGGATYKVTMPANPNTDEKIKLTSQSTTGSYPIIFGPTSITSNSTYQGYYNTGITINPNTKTITATTFVGALTGTASGNLTSSSTLNWNKVTENRPTTLSGYGITDAKINNGVITLGGNTITPFTGVAITNLSVGTDTTDNKTYLYVTKSNSATPQKLSLEDITIVSAEGATAITDTNGNKLNVDGPVYFDAGVPTTMLPTSSTGKFLKDDGTWATLPLAANGTRGGVQIGYTENNKNYAVKLSSEKMYVTVPWTDTNYYHTSGSWDGLTYTATANGGAGELAFTLPTGTTSSTVAAGNHTHGNITNGGDITATAPQIENGDQLIINDNSTSKITNGPTFDGSTTTKALTPKGTWETFLKTYTEQYTGTVTTVTAGSGLNTSDNQTDDAAKGSITGSGTLYLTKSGATAGSYGPSTNAEPGYGTTFNVPYVTVDKYGRVTAISSKTVKIPASDNTNTTYTLTNALSSHKFTWTFTAGGSGSGFTTTTAELAAGTGITLTDDVSNKKITIGCSVVNTDTLMTQNYSTTNNVYPLLMTATAGTSSTSSRGAVTGILNNSMYGNPSKGLVNALIYQMNEKADMRYDSTLDAIVFSFA